MKSDSSRDEIELDRMPLTIYPPGHQPALIPWVRIGTQSTQVRAVIARVEQLR